MEAKPSYQYQALQEAYDHFNAALFNNELPQCMIVLHRKKGAAGYFWSDMWSGIADKRALDEISLTPETLDRSDEVVLSTLVHEMVHLWQAHYGKPSRSGYHNKEWAQRMFMVGLQPSTDGTINGKPTGQRCTHLIQPGGAFQVAAQAFLKDRSVISWYGKRAGRFSSAKKNKIVYECSCGNKLWGKPGLAFSCDDCEEQYVERD